MSKASPAAGRREALEIELAYIDGMRADGWELQCGVGIVGDYNRHYYYWVDTLRPDLDLNPAELPRLRGAR